MKRGIVERGLQRLDLGCIADRIGYDTNDCPTNPSPVHTSSLLVELGLEDPEQLLSCRHAAIFQSFHDKIYRKTAAFADLGDCAAPLHYLHK